MARFSFDDPPNTEAGLMRDLGTLGVEPGMLVMVHSSLSAIGHVIGGAPVVVRALIECLGSDGTLAMPAATPECLDPARWTDPVVPEDRLAILRDSLPPFDVATSPTSMGAIAETFRNWPGTVRSDHPLSSVCARGPLADAITADHSPDISEGVGTPFEKLHDLDGRTLLLGVGFNRCTSLHFAESLTAQRRTTMSRFVTLEAGDRVWMEAPDMADDNGTHFPIVGAEFMATGRIRSGCIGRADAVLFSTRELVAFARRYFDRVL